MRPSIIGWILPAKRFISELDPNTKRFMLFGVPLIELFRYKQHLNTCRIQPYGATFATHDPYNIAIHDLNFAAFQRFRVYHLMRLNEATAWKSDLVVFNGSQLEQIEGMIGQTPNAIKKLK
jgi:hypothetical protein